jgi:hypothetical protein
MITGMKKHFLFHIRRVSVLRFLYFNFFTVSFYIAFLSDVMLCLSVSKFYLSCF